MKEFVNEKDQLKNIEILKDNIKNGNLDAHLDFLSLFLDLQITNMKTFLIEGKPVEEYDIYKTHYPIFMDISKKAINRFDQLSCFGFNEKEIAEFKKPNPDKEELSRIILTKLGITINESIKDVKSKKEEFLEKLTEKVTAETNTKMVNLMYFSKEELNAIMNGLTDSFYLVDKLKEITDEKIKEWTILHLYADIFEVYLKILKEIYVKLTKKRIKNSEVYAFFNNNYPMLLESAKSKLRNDVNHLNYKEREKYSLDEVNNERIIITIKVLTALISRNDFIISFFNDSSQKLTEIMNSKSKTD